jgi:hypothetical protein
MFYCFQSFIELTRCLIRSLLLQNEFDKKIIEVMSIIIATL